MTLIAPEEISLKTALLAVPLIASTLAIVYDVGFFLGLDLNFFTFFSLSEHVVFALQAIPVALAVVILLFLNVVLGWLGFMTGLQDANEFREIEGRRLQNPQNAVPLVLRHRLIRFLNLHRTATRHFVLFGFVACLAVLIATRLYLVALIFGIATVAVGSRVYWKVIREDWQLPIGAAAVSISALALSFVIGFTRASEILASTTPTETIHTDIAIPARVIRSGERGVLFFSVRERKLQFVRWDVVKLIESSS